ncbi:MAG: SDR family oxidoreductase [Kiloniellales bacterium]|nr:SDR family oxidoreductase [Kiloniellales bacterium]
MFVSDLLKDKRVLVTGGGTGLGKSMARRFLELGAGVILLGRREEVLGETKAEFDRDFDGRTATASCDIRDPEAVEATVGTLWAEQGGLDALVNNAAGNILAPSESLSHRAVDAVLGIVLHGSAYMTLACGRRWLESGTAGNVLSIVTTYAWTGSGYVLPSAMGKAGVLAMTRSLAVEWGGRGIRLNAIAPGPFPTEGAWSRLVPNKEIEKTWLNRVPLGRVGRHEELTDLAAYLLAEQSGYVNGEVVTIDGGEWLKGAGQFSVMDQLSDEEWAAFRPKKG